MADNALLVAPGVFIPRSELTARASRSSGPGGQHVNTSSTRVEVRWNVKETAVMDDETRDRVFKRLGKRADADGTVRVVSSESRSQRVNRERAEMRLAELVRRALVVPKKRKATAPTRASVERRLQAKKKRSVVKRNRHTDDD